MFESVRQFSLTVMRGAPLVPIAAGLIAGIMFDRSVQPWIGWYAAIFFAVAAAVWSRRIRSMAAPLLVGLAAMSVGGMLYHDRVHVVPPLRIDRYTARGEQLARLFGRVVSPPQFQAADDQDYEFARWTYRSDRTVFLFDVKAAETDDGTAQVTGRVRVAISEAVLDLSEGERVEVFGWLHPLYEQRNPGAFDWSAYLRRQGIVAQMYCPHRENVRVIEPSGDRGLVGTFVASLRNHARALLLDDLATGAQEDASLLEAMVLGHRSKLDRRLNDLFIRAGCVHFLAVSGFHVAVLMSFVWLVCRMIGLRRRRAAWIMAIVLPLYALIAEPRAPILRATILGLLFCGSLILRRSRSHLNWIAAAVIILLAIQPLDLFDVGFQLSFLAVFGVGYLGVRALPPAILEAFAAVQGMWAGTRHDDDFAEEDRELIRQARDAARAPAGRWSHIARRCRSTLVMTLAITSGAWLAGAPIVAFFFHRIQPWGVLSSAFVFPLVYAVMLLGVVKVLAAGLFAPLGSLLAAPLRWVESILVSVVSFFAGLPGSTFSFAQPPWWLIVTYYVLLIAFSIRFGRRQKTDTAEPGHRPVDPQEKPRSIYFTVALGGFVIAATTWALSSRNDDALFVHTLAVGNGTAIVMELPTGETILFDAGSASPYDVGRSTIAPFLRSRGIDRIDRIYVTHPNLDHFSGIPTLLDEFDCGPVVINEYFAPRSSEHSPSRHLLDLLHQRHHPVIVEDASQDVLSFGDVRFERLWPPHDLDEAVPTNDTSTVLRVTYANRSVLLTGDIENAAQEALDHKVDVRADVLMLPHHGSVADSLDEFVRKVTAPVWIRSSGQSLDETFNGLTELASSSRAQLLSTADVGAITVAIAQGELRIITVHGPSTQESTTP